MNRRPLDPQARMAGLSRSGGESNRETPHLRERIEEACQAYGSRRALALVTGFPRS